MKITIKDGLPPLGAEYGDVWISWGVPHIRSGDVEKCDAPCTHCRPRYVGYWLPVTSEEAELHMRAFSA
jgi:hypothetical protein